MGFYLRLKEPKQGIPKLENDPHCVEKRWKVDFVNAKDMVGNYGEVSWSKRTIRIWKKASLLDVLFALLHEVHHVSEPDTSEHAVMRTELNQIRVIGWFLKKHGKELLEELYE